VSDGGRIVPWLAAEGPLAYCPESPPDRDYYFQYGWVLPGIFATPAARRRHHYFGAPCKQDASELFAFWEDARRGQVDRVACLTGRLDSERIHAPIAIYRTERYCRSPAYALIQHGSYQLARQADQPHLESGELLLYRGLQSSPEFRFFQPGSTNLHQRGVLQSYLRIQAHVLSDATRSFNSIHDRASRCETGHLRDRSWLTDDIAREHGLEIDGNGFAAALWSAVHQSFALERWVAESKFGPHYVVCKTPVDNVRTTTFFAGEHEVRVIDPRRVEVVEAHGCRVVDARLRRERSSHLWRARCGGAGP
jgi:hypothetical protein